MGPDEMVAQFRAKNEARFPKLKEIRTHPALDCIPLMTDDEFTRLVWSIEKSGLIDPIVMADACIIDGRCRYIGCKTVGAETGFKEFKYDSDPDDKDEAIKSYIVSANLMRQSYSRAELCLDDARMAALYPDYPETLVSARRAAAGRRRACS